jgi:signal transduction histidine kinase
VLSDLEIAIEKSGAEIHVDDLPAIEADPLQLRQLFQNLLSNAIKFQKEGQNPVIYIHHQVSELKNKQDKPVIKISVEDNGIGFDEKYLDKIFTIFQRLAGKEYAGSGVGLAICKKIALRHGGDITAKSEIGKGTVFIVTLPMRQATEHSF